MNREEEDRVAWIDSRNEIFSIKPFYFILEFGRTVSFLMGIIWKVMDFLLEWTFLLGISIRERYDFRSTLEEIVNVGK